MKPGEKIEELIQIMATLRSEDGCPWDREQTLSTLKPFLIEETYEVLETMNGENWRPHCEELGDLLFQIVFQARIRQEQSEFGIDEVIETLAMKLKRRHPHIFGDRTDLTRSEVADNWRKMKALERKTAGSDTSAVAGVPIALPALLRAQRLGSKASGVGFDWPDTTGVLDKVREETAEVIEAMATGQQAAMEHEIGDLLFSVVNLARHLKIEPETALQNANNRFERRFREVERLADCHGAAIETLSASAMEALWDTVKASEI
jgi:MazG family protein